MPSIEISTAQLNLLFGSDDRQVCVVTPLGNTILEIQGDLEIPAEPPVDMSKFIEEDNGDKRFTVYNGENIVRFGLLLMDDKKNATLYIGKKQRLLGKVVKLETPLGMLKFNNDADDDKKTVELQDIFHYKIIFNNRPLPIM